MSSLKQQHTTRQHLGALCSAAVQQQIERGDAQPAQLRQRRRHLLKALHKRLPQSAKRSPEKLLHSAVMILALWGFGGLAMPGAAQAAATFEHVMLEGFDVGYQSTPTFADIDNDGDLDAFVGERYGRVKFYQNNGSASAPTFVPTDGTTIINPLAGFNVTWEAAPTFADIDNDGDLDAFVGEHVGTVKFYQNNGNPSAPNFVAADGVTVVNPLNMVAVGNSAAPTFADIDNDGDMDAFVGERYGTVKFYKNIGNASIPDFVIADGTNVINPMAGFDVGWNATPSFADIDNDGDLDLFVGEGNTGVAKFYKNSGTDSEPNFVPADGVTIINPLAAFASSWQSPPTFADIDNDGDLDLFMGSRSGVVRFYQNNGSASAPSFIAAIGVTIINPLATFDVGHYAAPTFADIDSDGDLDAFVGSVDGTIKFYQNTGTVSTPNFVAAVDTSSSPGFAAANGVTIINPLAGVVVGSRPAPCFIDIDSDGDLDLFVGISNGTVKFYQNNGSATAANFVAANGTTVINPLAGFDVGNYAVPTFADIDNDGDMDAFVSEQFFSRVKYYQNDGTPSAPSFVPANGTTVINPLAGVYLGIGQYAALTFADIDTDGDLDTFVGAYDGTVKFYQNDSTSTVLNFVAANGTTIINPLAGFSVGRGAIPTFADIDNDGDLDAFIGESVGTVRFIENTEFARPIVVNDTASTEENTILNSSVSLLANDSDVKGYSLSATAGTFTTTQGGSITINTDGNYTYTPPSGFSGIDTVDYTVSNGSLTSIGTLTITINAAASTGGGGGGAPGIPLLATLAALLFGSRRNITIKD